MWEKGEAEWDESMVLRNLYVGAEKCQVKPGSHLDVNSRKVTQGLAEHDGFSLVHMESWVI